MNKSRRFVKISIILMVSLSLIFTMSGMGYALVKEGVFYTENKILSAYFNLSKDTIDFLFYRNLYEESVKKARDERDILQQFKDDATIETTLMQRSAVLKLALEKGLINQSTVSERKQALIQKNPNLPAEEAEQIVAMQIYSSVNSQIMLDVLPSLMDGTYKTNDVELLAAMNNYHQITNSFEDFDKAYKLQTETILQLYKEYLNYLVRSYEN